MSFTKYLFLSIIAGIAPAGVLAAMDDLPRTDTPIEIDGVLDEAAWARSLRVDLGIEVQPAANEPAPVATTAFLIEDGENLYVAFQAEDPDPERIRAYLRDRDSAWSDDHVGIILDTYNDERRAFAFYANPLGVQMDTTHDEALGGRRGNDESWDAIWDSAGRIDDDGYVVEMRIPLSQLRFPDVEGEKTWGYDLVRHYPRTLSHHLSNNSRDRNRNCYLCQVGKFRGLEGSRPSRDLEVVPTLIAAQNETTDDPGFEPLTNTGTEAEVGVTVRWGITPDLTANLTVNPDFSQVEADVARLNVNNQFALYFPETRPFFLEGADYFNSPINAIYTRTVAAPEFGAKLTGQKGDHTFGVFAARDEITGLLFPGLYESDTETLEQPNDAFVGRYSLGFENASSVGALVTLRDGDDYHNYVGGLDARWRINDNHTIDFQYLQSETEYPLETAIEFDQPTDTFTGRATMIEYEYESRNWFGDIEYYDYSEGFRADSGFEPTVGGDLLELRFGRVFHGTGDTWWHRIRMSLHYDELNEESGDLAERESAFRMGIGGPLQSWFSLVVLDKKERDEGTLYDLNKVGAFLELQPTAGLQLGAFVGVGDQIDYTNGRLGDERLVEPYVTWNVNRNLSLRLRGVYLELDTKDGERIFEARLADTRVVWQFNLRSFLRLTVQFQDVERNPDVYVEPTDAREKDVGRQLLYSYKINPRTVFFLGYSDRYVDNDALDKLTVEDRTVFMKIGYAWTP